MQALRSESHKDAIPLSERFRGALWGQFVGDAACLGSHWIYDESELQELFPKGLAGFEAPVEDHYHQGKLPGDPTHYGEAALLMLESVNHCGKFSEEDFSFKFASHFRSHRYKGYLDKPTKGTLANMAKRNNHSTADRNGYRTGIADCQPATVTRLTPLVVAHYGLANLAERVEVATRICQNDNRAVAYAHAHATILAELFQGRDIHETLERTAELMRHQGQEGQEVQESIQSALAANSMSITEATKHFGLGCPLEQSFPAAVHALVKEPSNFRQAILQIAQAGGDNAARAAMVGTWLGACLGTGAVPADWIERLREHDKLKDLIATLVASLD